MHEVAQPVNGVYLMVHAEAFGYSQRIYAPLWHDGKANNEMCIRVRQGVFFDPDTVTRMRPLVGSWPFQDALQFWRSMAPYANPSAPCTTNAVDFHEGQCLMMIAR
jgi:hypothetical protein